MKPGDRVKLSAQGRRSLSTEGWPGAFRWAFSPDVRGTVVRPGLSRGGIRVRVRVDGAKKDKNYAAFYWELDEKKGT